MKQYLLDSSYFSHMLHFYLIDDERFNFVWEALKQKILDNEILVTDKVVIEIKYIKSQSNFVNSFLSDIRHKITKTNQADNIPIIKFYEQNKEKFKGSWDNFSKETSADLTFIGFAYQKLIKENLECIILTDEIMPNIANETKKVKLNIPSLARVFNIQCLELKDSIDVITGES